MITLFYARYRYINPGMPALLDHLATRPAFDFRAVDVTPRSIAEIRRLAAESTVIVIDQSVENAATWARPGEYSVYYVVDQKPNAFYEEVRDTFLMAPAGRVFVGYFDLHDPRLPATFERFHGRVEGLAWMYEKAPVDPSVVPPQYVDPWIASSGDGRATWELARRTFPIRIEIPFALTAAELLPRPVSQRWDACVAGAHYATRRIAQRQMTGAGLSVAPYRVVSRSVAATTRVLSRITPGQMASEVTIRVQQTWQAFVVRRSRVNFVCGSALAYPVRKFFEVPAAGSAMIAYPCVGFADYGFVDGVNVAASLPEDVGKVARRLVADSPLRARLTAHALEMVRTLHSVERRAADFVECLRRFHRGQLRSAQFLGGRFEIG